MLTHRHTAQLGCKAEHHRRVARRQRGHKRQDRIARQVGIARLRDHDGGHLRGQGGVARAHDNALRNRGPSGVKLCAQGSGVQPAQRIILIRQRAFVGILDLAKINARQNRL